MALTSYAVFDLETTGLDPGHDAITEIGWCVVRDGVPSACRSLLINAGVPVPDDVAAITGITTDLLERHGVSLCEALATFRAAVGDLPLVGHNIVRFDAPFLEVAFDAELLFPPDRCRYVDTGALFVARRLGLRPGNRSHWQFAQDILSQRQRFKWNLGACCLALRIPCGDVPRHRAAGDCILTERLYRALTATAD